MNCHWCKNELDYLNSKKIYDYQDEKEVKICKECWNEGINQGIIDLIPQELENLAE